LQGLDVILGLDLHAGTILFKKEGGREEGRKGRMGEITCQEVEADV